MSYVDLHVLDNEHISCADLSAWKRWCEANPTKGFAARSEVGDVAVTTFFLGTNRDFPGSPPGFFETVVFGYDDESWTNFEPRKRVRYVTGGEAILGHDTVVEQVKSEQAAAAAMTR